jgi:probable rRNA maturation factor
LKVNFFTEPPLKFVLKNKTIYKKWLGTIADLHNSQLRNVNYIFTDDEYLLDINKRYLNHDYYTDIISFPIIEADYTDADLFISIDRVRDNASSLKIEFEQELSRVMVHGLLHLCGYKDKTKSDQLIMRLKEDEALSLLGNP